jgi:cell division septum initiation protein DivIVA
MASADRKETGSKQSQASRRGGVLRRGSRRKDKKSPAESQQQPDRGSPEAVKGDAAPKPADGEKVSSLLETTGEEVKQLLEAADDAAKKIREAARANATSGGDDESDDGDEVSSLIARTNKEVQQVLESADDAAEKIRQEARAEARQFIDDARRRAESVTNEQMHRVSDMTEHVLDELSGVKQQLKTLRGAFDQAMKTMSADLGVEETEVWERQGNGAVGADEEPSDMRARLGRRRAKMVPAQEPEGISEGARLLALQQLTAGVDADVIEKRLKKEFGIENPKPILEWMGMQAEPTEKAKKR